MQLHFAPLQGYADHIYRRRHREIYGDAVDWYYTPFIRMEKGAPRRQDMKRLELALGDGTPLIPQIMFNTPEEFVILAQAVKALGCERIDLNLGCPYPMVMRKGRGAAMIADIPTMERVCSLIAEDVTTSYSVKMRLGLDNPDEWRALLPVLNSVSLAHITIHPRIARQLYGGEMFVDMFAEIAEVAANPLIYNGDILMADDIDTVLGRFPGIMGVMIGRGMLARPSLAAEWREGAEWDEVRRMDHILRFHDAVLGDYRDTLCGDTQILQKIKPFWEYLAPTIGHRVAKSIRKATSLPKYLTALEPLR